MPEIVGHFGQFVLTLATGGVGTILASALVRRWQEARALKRGQEGEKARLHTMLDDSRASMAALVVLAIEHGATRAEAEACLPPWWRTHVMRPLDPGPDDG
ncbi:hypothetical protein [Actinomyces radicidentis]|uniref:hypothetical protein n=1 Tax=Actinomyces radicidentis TaxID=111015 RepID=UPI0028E946AF|nr:hypothetical protein [Actinomyces radicidentis]